MKLVIISFIVAICLFPALGHAEPITVKLEWVEIDRTQCPDLAKAINETKFAESSHQSFVDLENSKLKRVRINHVQHIEPGSKSQQSAEMNGQVFDLSLNVSLAEEAFYEVEMEASLQKEDESRWGTTLVQHFSTKIKLSHGNSFAFWGLMKIEGDNEIIQILIISLVEPWNTSLAAGPPGCPIDDRQ